MEWARIYNQLLFPVPAVSCPQSGAFDCATLHSGSNTLKQEQRRLRRGQRRFFTDLPEHPAECQLPAHILSETRRDG